MRTLTSREKSRRNDVMMRASAKLMSGKRLECRHPHTKLVLYLGSSSVDRRDPFWLEHPGGRTYAERPEGLVMKAIDHVGTAAVDKALVHDDRRADPQLSHGHPHARTQALLERSSSSLRLLRSSPAAFAKRVGRTYLAHLKHSRNRSQAHAATFHDFVDAHRVSAGDLHALSNAVHAALGEVDPAWSGSLRRDPASPRSTSKVVIRGTVVKKGLDKGRVHWTAHVFLQGHRAAGAASMRLFEVEDWARRAHPHVRVVLVRPPFAPRRFG